MAVRNPAWSFIIEVLVRLNLYIIFWVSDDIAPFERVIQPEEWWLYKNPHKPDTVSSYAVLGITFLVPLFGILVYGFINKDKIDTKKAILGLTLSLSFNGVVTNVIKLLVGRPRPDFFFRCIPNSIATTDFTCAGVPEIIIQGRKSFPSGHSSWSFAGLGYLSWYLAGKLQCFQTHGRGYGWRVCLSFAPSMAAMIIALTRYSDYRHHWQDITVGSILAWMSYRQYYPSITRPMSQVPYVNIHPGVQRTKDDLEQIIISGDTLPKKSIHNSSPNIYMKAH